MDGSGGNVALGSGSKDFGGNGSGGTGGGAAGVPRRRPRVAKLMLMQANDKVTNNNNLKQPLKAAMVLNWKEASFFQI